jgi:hypothetical protein
MFILFVVYLATMSISQNIECVMLLVLIMNKLQIICKKGSLPNLYYLPEVPEATQ